MANGDITIQDPYVFEENGIGEFVLMGLNPALAEFGLQKQLKQGTTYYDIPNDYMYIIFGEDENWYAKRYWDFDEKTAIQTTVLPTGTDEEILDEIKILTYS